MDTRLIRIMWHSKLCQTPIHVLLYSELYSPYRQIMARLKKIFNIMKLSWKHNIKTLIDLGYHVWHSDFLMSSVPKQNPSYYESPLLISEPWLSPGQFLFFIHGFGRAELTWSPFVSTLGKVRDDFSDPFQCLNHCMLLPHLLIKNCLANHQPSFRWDFCSPIFSSLRLGGPLCHLISQSQTSAKLFELWWFKKMMLWCVLLECFCNAL